MTNIFRPYQEEAYNAIISEISENPKCLVKMFCGSGKSLIMSKVVSHFKRDLSVFVFPSLSLVDQFYTDYIMHLYPKQNVLNISSDVDSTTNPQNIMIFLNKNIKKIICTTYQSLNILLTHLGEHKIGICCFDEAHHSVGKKYQKFVFDTKSFQSQVFFTATPNNANDIVMQGEIKNKNTTIDNWVDIPDGNCGKLTYDYTYKRGVEEGYLNTFEVRYDLMCSEIKKNRIIYESIARAILTTGNNRVLTFHSKITKSATSVYKFTKEKKFIEAFHHIITTEFPEKKHFYKSIKMIGLDAKIKQKKRRDILNLLDTCIENEIVIICSCKTIGEGIDTKNANMCVFVDPKSSIVEIIQNIGRVVRKQFGVDKSPSTVLVPYWLDNTTTEYTEYKSQGCDYTTHEKIIAKNSKYKGILGVVNTLIQGGDIVVNKNKDTQKDKEDKDKLKQEKLHADALNRWKNYFSHVKAYIEFMVKNTGIEEDQDHKKNEREFSEKWMKENKQIIIKSSDYQLSSWISRQKKNYIKKTEEMQFEEIYVLWTTFLEEYKQHLHLFDYKWNDKLKSLKMFIQSNAKLPSIKNGVIGSWFLRQKLDYKRKIGGMKKEERNNQWTLFLASNPIKNSGF